MKSVRPALAVASGTLSLILMPVAITGIVLAALEPTGFSWWGFGGSIGLAVASLFGMIGGFGRLRWGLTMHWLFSWIGAGFAVATCALMWQATQVPGFRLNGLQIGETAVLFVAAVLAFISGAVGFAAANSRDRDINSPADGPSWVVEEKAKANIIRANRVVSSFAIMAMLCGAATITLTAIEKSYSSWWAFGGAIGIVFSSIFGIAAGFRARRGLHIVNAMMMFTAVAFTLVGVGSFFHGAHMYGYLTDMQIAIASVGFVAAVFGFISALTSAVTIFSYRRRLLPIMSTTTTTYNTITTAPLLSTAPGLSPRGGIVVESTVRQPIIPGPTVIPIYQQTV